MTRWEPKTYTYNGESHTIKEWAEIKGISYATLQARIKRNLPQEVWFIDKIPSRPHNKPGRKDNRNRMPYTWSVSAQECYHSGCRCSTCTMMPEDLKSKCRMKNMVRELVRLYGAPEEKECIND